MSKRPRPGRGLLSAAILGAVLVGCSAVEPTLAPSSPTPTPGASPTGSPVAPSPTIVPTDSPEPTTPPTCAEGTLAGMTEDQRIGQLFMVGLAGDVVTAGVRDAVATYHLGSFWYLRSTAGVAALRIQSDRLQALATADATAGVGFLLSANQEGGLVQGLSGPGFDTIPSALTQGTWSTGVLADRAGIWGSQLADAGVNTNFAPVADIVPPGTDSQNAPIGQLYREYGHDAARVSTHVAAFIAGMQAAGIATTAKHFPGLGRVEGNTDFTAAVVDNVTTFDDPYLGPFGSAVSAGTPFVMVSLATYTKIDPNHIAAFSPRILKDLLRDSLGFDGVIMSDSLSATAVVGLNPGPRAIKFIEAGGDLIVLTPLSQAITMAKALQARVAVNATTRADVDRAALRILEAKDAASLLPCS